MVIQKLRHGDHLGKGLSSNTYSAPLNNTTSYRSNTKPESKQYKYLEDALTVCCICGLPPEQAAKEFHEEFKKSPLPNYFEWWRNCWNEYEITPEMVREWLEKCYRLGWLERLTGGAAA